MAPKLHRQPHPRERRTAVLMLTPYLAGLALLVIGPAAATVVLAFTEYDLIGSPSFNGVDNFEELAGDRVFWTSLRNSVIYLAFAVPSRVAAALGLALLLHRRMRGIAAYRTSAYLPTIVPDMAYALLWLWLLNPLYGPINLVLGAIGAPEPQWMTDPAAAMAAVIMMGVFQVGEGFLIAMAARQQIPDVLYELAAIEGANAWQQFRRITLPVMTPALLLLLLRDTAFSLQASFVPALIVTGGGPPPHATTFLPLFVYRNGFEYLRYGYASAATLVMFAVTAAIVVVQYWLIRRWRRTLIFWPR